MFAGIGHHPVDGLLAGPARVVEAGIDDDAAGTEQLALQVADAPERIAFECTHLVRQLFGIQGPALGPRREAHRAPEQRQSTRLAQDAVLEMVTGYPFVMQQRRDAPQGVLRDRAQVEEDGRSLGGIAAGAVESARRAVLDRGRDALHLDRPIRNHPETPRQQALDPIQVCAGVVDDRLASRFRIRLEEARVAIQGGHALTHRSACQALRAQQLIDLGRQFFYPGQAELMQLTRRITGRGVRMQGRRVVGLAVRLGPDARPVVGAGLQGRERRALALQGRHDALDEDRRGATVQIGNPGIARTRQGRCRQCIAGRRRIAQGRDLPQGLGQDEIRGDDAQARIVADLFGLLVQGHGELAQLVHVAVGVRGVLHGRASADAVRQPEIGAVHLADDIGAGSQVQVGKTIASVLVCHGLVDEAGRVVVQRRGSRKRGTLDTAQFDQAL